MSTPLVSVRNSLPTHPFHYPHMQLAFKFLPAQHPAGVSWWGSWWAVTSVDPAGLKHFKTKSSVLPCSEPFYNPISFLVFTSFGAAASDSLWLCCVERVKGTFLHPQKRITFIFFFSPFKMGVSVPTPSLSTWWLKSVHEGEICLSALWNFPLQFYLRKCGRLRRYNSIY